MFWNLGFSKLILGKKLAWQQLVGATAVVAGVCTAALPAEGGAGIFSGVRAVLGGRLLLGSVGQRMRCVGTRLIDGRGVSYVAGPASATAGIGLVSNAIEFWGW